MRCSAAASQALISADSQHDTPRFASWSADDTLLSASQRIDTQRCHYAAAMADTPAMMKPT